MNTVKKVWEQVKKGNAKKKRKGGYETEAKNIWGAIQFPKG